MIRALYLDITLDIGISAKFHRIAEQLERLSHHTVRGEVWPRAMDYLHQAGMKPLSRSANHEAVSYLTQSLDALEQLPKSRENVEKSIDLHLELRSALHPLGEFERGLDALQRAFALAESITDKRRQGRVAPAHWRKRLRQASP